MALKDVLKQAMAFVLPSKKEEMRISSAAKEICQRLDAQFRKEKIPATAFVGGSVGKGTWLPGISDIDFFILFDYEAYKDKSAQLSDFAGRVLKKAFGKITRLHGSRDYFSADYKGIYSEFVPVLKIKSTKEAKNLTDFSPLHVRWIKSKIKRNQRLQTEVRLAKQFFKSVEVYGAESYISGFSGHAIEILTIYYGGFLNLLKNALKWREKQVFDAEKRFKNEKEVFETLNESKLQSPLILIDPVEPGRNALAALNKENFYKLKGAAKAFLAKPHLSFFREKNFSVETLRREKSHRKLIVAETKPTRGKPDVVGCELLGKFNKIKSEFEKNDFKILESGWHWPEHGPAIFWFYFPNHWLEKTKLHFGPPASMKEFAAKFRKKWKKVKIIKGVLATEVKRKYVTPERLIKDLIRTDRTISLY